jgi:FkbM family methyltransferase
MIDETQNDRIYQAGSALPGPFGYWFQKRIQLKLAPLAHRAFEAAIDALGPDDICLDLGANVGVFTARMAETGAQVHAFEPDSAPYEALEKRVAGMDNVVLHNAAIGVQDGTAVLNRAKRYDKEPLRKSVGSSVVRTGRRWMDSTFSETVKVIGLFDYLDQLERPASVVKMDIEGAEWPILEAMHQGRGLDRFDMLFVETHERFNTWALMPKLRQLNAFAAGLEHPQINLHWE